MTRSSPMRRPLPYRKGACSTKIPASRALHSKEPPSFNPRRSRGAASHANEKAQNRLISRIRVRVEHAINGVKRYRIVKDQLRNWKANFRDQVMETCCGLHNFRLRFRSWSYFSVVA